MRALHVAAKPATPVAGVTALYPKPDGRWYGQASDGIEHKILYEGEGGGTGGISAEPVGTIAMWGGLVAPERYLLCDGSAVSRLTYPQLFSTIGTTYGAGDGSTTFNVPDMRGKFVLGPAGSHPPGQSGGEENHILTTAEMPSHSHTGATSNDSPDHAHNVGIGWAEATNDWAFNNGGEIGFQRHASTTTNGANARHVHGIYAEGGGGAHNNMPPFTVVTYIIKATPAATGDLGPGIEIRDEGVIVLNGAVLLDFIGGQVSATLNGAKVDIKVPGAPSGAPADQMVTPANPANGKNKLYFKADNKLYMLDSTGVEKEVGTGAAGGGGGSGQANVPVGTVEMWSGPLSQMPQGYLACDGSSQIRSAYPELFAAIGTTYGEGANTGVTFALPNYGGRFPVGVDGTKLLGSKGGEEYHTLTVAELPAHSHGGVTGNQNALHSHVQAQGGPISTVANAAGGYIVGSANTSNTQTETTNHQHSIPNEGAGAAHNNMPPYVAMYYIIKATPVSPGSTALHPNPNMEFITTGSTVGNGSIVTCSARDVPASWAGYWGNTTVDPPWRSATDTPSGTGKSLEMLIGNAQNSKPQSASFAVIPGSKVRVGAWVKFSAIGSINLWIEFMTGTNYTPDFFDGSSANQSIASNGGVKTTWNYVEATFTIPAGHTRARMSLNVANNSGAQISAFMDETITSMDPVGVTPAVNGTLPIGGLAPFAGSTVPSGWLLCDGSSKKRADYPELFATIGVVYGSVDGNTFNVPDLRGRDVIGSGTGSGLSGRALGAKGGEEAHILTMAEMPAHSHGGAGKGFIDGTINGTLGGAGYYSSGLPQVATEGGGQYHNNMQPFAVLNYIIKALEIYQGIGGDTLEWAAGSPVSGQLFGTTAVIIPIAAGSLRGSGCTLVPSGALAGTIQVSKAGVYRISGNITATAAGAGYLHGQIGIYRGGLGIIFNQAVSNINAGYGSVDMDTVVELLPGDSVGLVAASQQNSNIDGRSNLAINRMAGPGPKGDKGTLDVTAWTALPFATGWANYGSSIRTCAYRKVGDTTELRGLAQVASGGGYTIGTLPPGYRPAATEIFNAPNADQIVWRFDANPDGTLVIGGGQTIQLNPGDWVSMSGIRFVADQ
jgi:microcystin-dependent protein